MPGKAKPKPPREKDNKSNLGLLFDVQRFCLHDGPGIRTTLFFKGCPLRCRWCQNPESHSDDIEVAFYKERCVSCFECREVCQENAIAESEESRIDFDRCNRCGDCVCACMHDALKLVGKWWYPSDLLDEVIKDRDFFDDSAGGITLSGGEPSLYHRFLKSFLPLAQQKSLHVNMETCGMFQWKDLEPILPFLDLIYYDLKLMDSTMHQTYTGVTNKTILENFSELAKVFPNLQARMPLIPSINDTRENIEATAQFLIDNHSPAIHLLTYHKLGEAKLARIHTDLRPLNLPAVDSEAVNCTKKWFEEQGIAVSVY